MKRNDRFGRFYCYSIGLVSTNDLRQNVKMFFECSDETHIWSV